MREVDRSRIIEFQKCPRSRFVGYELNGKGLQMISKSLPLQFGSAFHEGVGWLLQAGNDGPDEGVLDRGQIIDEAVTLAQTFLRTQFRDHHISFDSELPTDAMKAMEYGKEEQFALAEALIRGWWIYEGSQFLDQFEVIEVEREGRAILSYGVGNLGKDDPNYRVLLKGANEDDLVLMFRPDALVREKSSGDLFIVSWKTCATFGKRNVDQSRHDMQSMSEAWGVQNAQCEDEGCDHHGTSHGCNNPKHIEGVLYKWIVKGRRTLDEWDQLYKQDSPLIYGWMKLGQSEEEDEWSWKYSWTDPDEVNERTGKPVGHKLPKGFRKVPIWRDYSGGVKQWIEDLSQQKINPRHENALRATFPEATPVERR